MIIQVNFLILVARRCHSDDDRISYFTTHAHTTIGRLKILPELERRKKIAAEKGAKEEKNQQPKDVEEVWGTTNEDYIVQATQNSHLRLEFVCALCSFSLLFTHYVQSAAFSVFEALTTKSSGSDSTHRLDARMMEMKMKKIQRNKTPAKKSWGKNCAVRSKSPRQDRFTAARTRTEQHIMKWRETNQHGWSQWIN